jgi:hypothetical protein
MWVANIEVKYLRAKEILLSFSMIIIYITKALQTQSLFLVSYRCL